VLNCSCKTSSQPSHGAMLLPRAAHMLMIEMAESSERRDLRTAVPRTSFYGFGPDRLIVSVNDASLQRRALHAGSILRGSSCM